MDVDGATNDRRPGGRAPEGRDPRRRAGRGRQAAPGRDRAALRRQHHAGARGAGDAAARRTGAHAPAARTVVFLPTVDDLRHHYEIRAALESLAAAKAAERFEAAWAEPLEAVLAEMGDGPAAARYLALNQRFHTTLYEHSERPQLAEMIAALRDASSVYLHTYGAQSDFPVARLDAEHHAILCACLDQDPERAAAATRAHLENTV